MSATLEQFTFVAEHFDSQSSLAKRYNLFYWPVDNTLEIYDIRMKKTFLKRTAYPLVSLQQLYVGNTINIYSRQYQLLSYGDLYTAKALAAEKTTSIIIIKPTGIQYIGAILDILITGGGAADNSSSSSSRQQPLLTIHNMRMVQLSSAQHAEQLLQHQRYASADEFRQLCQELSADGGVIGVIEVIGSSSSSDGIASQFNALRNSANATDNAMLNNSVWIATSNSNAADRNNYLSALLQLPVTAIYNNSSRTPITIAVIKPHMLQSSSNSNNNNNNNNNISNSSNSNIITSTTSDVLSLGKLLDDIQSQGYLITAMITLQLDTTAAAEFLEVYEGVLPEYHALVEQYTSGKCCVLELTHERHGQQQQQQQQQQQHDDSGSGQQQLVTAFRSLCGPLDPAIGKHIRSDTLRARYGESKVKNALHCSDLVGDAVLEAEYFFSILQHKQ